MHSGWLPRLSLALAPLDERPARAGAGDNRRDVPQRWKLLRSATLHAPALRPSASMWIEGLRAALRASDLAPRHGDVLRAPTDRYPLIQLQFDGESWRPLESYHRYGGEPVAGGRLAFREDAPSPRLAAMLERAERRAVSAAEVEAVTLREASRNSRCGCS